MQKILQNSVVLCSCISLNLLICTASLAAFLLLKSGHPRNWNFQQYSLQGKSKIWINFKFFPYGIMFYYSVKHHLYFFLISEVGLGGERFFKSFPCVMSPFRHIIRYLDILKQDTQWVCLSPDLSLDGDSFYLFDRWFTPFSRIFHFYDRGQNCGGRKLGSAR